MLKKYLIKGSVIVSLMLALIWGRVLYLQHSHFAAAEKYYVESNWKLAIREYDLAMHFYTPLSPYQEKAARSLWKMGGMFEAEDKPDWANIAYSSIRSSFYASRSFYTPGQGWIKRCDEKIAALNVKIALREGSIKAEAADAERAKFLHVLKTDGSPDVLWSFAALAGFSGWVGSVIFIIFKGFGTGSGLSGSAAIRGRNMFYGILSFCLAYALWAIALLKA